MSKPSPRARAHAVLQSVLGDEAAGGKLIIFFAALALVVVNSPLQAMYEMFWTLDFSLGIGDAVLSQDLRHWVNEGLMAIFFLVVGLEIKRELVNGELKDPKKAILPFAAAIGGMVVPALIYFALNTTGETVRGWGIPIATDIAFAVAVLAFLSKRVPLSLKLFLLTLAIVDDIGAIFVIALFYAEIINYYFLALSAITIAVIWLIVHQGWLSKRLVVIIALLGILLWVSTHLSGIHASIVGAVLGLLAPVPRSAQTPSASKRLEKFFLPISTFIVLPVFAFANAGVALSGDVFGNPDARSVMIGVVAGLVLGKLAGISGATWLMVKLGLATLPTGTNWGHIIGVSLIAGIGFTVSIFITGLAFSDNQELIEAAKVSVFAASGLAATLGSLVIWRASKQ